MTEPEGGRINKILLVDDEASLRKLVRATLEDFNYELLEAADGKKGWEIARREKPNLILLDIAMPGMDGFEVCSGSNLTRRHAASRWSCSRLWDRKLTIAAVYR